MKESFVYDANGLIFIDNEAIKEYKMEDHFYLSSANAFQSKTVGNSLAIKALTNNSVISIYPIGKLHDNINFKFHIEYTNPFNDHITIYLKDAAGNTVVSFGNPQDMYFYMGEDQIGMCEDEISVVKADGKSAVTVNNRRFMFDSEIDHISFEYKQGSGTAGDTVYIVSDDIEHLYLDYPINSSFFWNVATARYQNHLLIAYYNESRQMVIKTVDIITKAEITVTMTDCVQSSVDVHNYIDCAFDANGGVHVCGNCHCSLPYYYKATNYTLSDIDSDSAFDEITSATYPFFVNKGNDLFFTIRSGVSGDSEDYSYKYNISTGIWSKTKETPTADGTDGHGGTAYFGRWVPMSDGYIYGAFKWRRTGDMRTNKDILVIKTNDFVNFYSADGTQMTLPINNTNDSAAVVLRTEEDVGIVNQWYVSMHEFNGKPVVVWMMYDEDGYSNIFAGYLSSGEWIIKQISHNKWIWEFDRVCGTDASMLNYNVTEIEDNLVVDVSSRFYGIKRYWLDESFETVKEEQISQEYYEKPEVYTCLKRYGNGFVSTAFTGRGRGNYTNNTLYANGKMVIY